MPWVVDVISLKALVSPDSSVYEVADELLNID